MQQVIWTTYVHQALQLDWNKSPNFLLHIFIEQSLRQDFNMHWRYKCTKTIMVMTQGIYQMLNFKKDLNKKNKKTLSFKRKGLCIMDLWSRETIDTKATGKLYPM